jgi:hypothetical protein
MTQESAQGRDGIASATTESPRKSFRHTVGFSIESNTGDAAEVCLARVLRFRDVTHLRLHDRRINPLRWTLKTTFLVGEGPGRRRVGNAIGIFAVGRIWRGRIFENSKIDGPRGAKPIGDEVIPSADRIGDGMNADGAGEIVSTAGWNDEKWTRSFCQRTQDAMNAAVTSDDDDGVRKIATLDFVSAKNVDACSLKWIEAGIGFIRMEDGSDAHSPIVNNRLYFRLKISDFRLKDESGWRGDLVTG